MRPAYALNPLTGEGHLDLSRVSVLILDDNRNTVVLFGEVLRGLGVRNLYRAGTCADALQRLRSTSIDAMLVDIAIGQEDGLDFVRRVRASADPQIADVAILVISAHATQSRVIESGVAGADRFLSKPVTVGALATRLGDVLAIPRPRPRQRPSGAREYAL